MHNYIKSELYRNFNRVYFWCMTGVIAAIALLGDILIKVTSNTPIYYEMVFTGGKTFLVIPVYIIMMIVDMVTSEEQKNQTLKNAVSFGISRKKIILSKFVTAIILAVISAVIILIVYFGSGAILFKVGDGFSLNIVKDFILRLLTALTLWIGAISVGNFLAILFKNNIAYAFTYFGLFGFLSNIIGILCNFVSPKFEYVYNILITSQLKYLSYAVVKTDDLIKAALIGIVYTIIFTTLSVIYFAKMEVK